MSDQVPPAYAEQYRTLQLAQLNIERGASVMMIVAGVQGVQQIRLNDIEARRIVGTHRASIVLKAAEDIAAIPELKEPVNVIA